MKEFGDVTWDIWRDGCPGERVCDAWLLCLSKTEGGFYDMEN